MVKKINLTVMILVISLLAGCGGGQQPSLPPMPQQINEPEISEFTSSYEPQVERVNNCDGATPTYLVSYKTIESQNATFEVIVGGGGLVTGTPIPEMLQVQLEAKIAASLSKQFGITVERNHELSLEIPDGKKMKHTIMWKVTKVKGIIDVVYGNGTPRVEFNKIANIELYDRQSEELSCNEGADLFTSQPLTDAPQNIPTNTATIIGTTPPPTSNAAALSTTPPLNSGVANQLDSIFSRGNWFCFPDRSDAVGVKVSNEATITSPIVKVDTAIGSYTSGRIPYGGGATVWLSKSVSTDECPSNQMSSITAWRSARSADTASFDKSRMDSLFGAGNWRCVPSFPYAVTVVNLPSGTAIQYPFTSIDNSSGKYGVGETMSQSGSATVWLAGSISNCQ